MHGPLNDMAGDETLSATTTSTNRKRPSDDLTRPESDATKRLRMAAARSAENSPLSPALLTGRAVESDSETDSDYTSSDYTSSDGSEGEVANAAAADASCRSSSSSSSTSSSSSANSSRPSSPIITLRPGKPIIQPIPSSAAQESHQLLSRLTTFLPGLAAANETLEEDRQAGRLAERELENVRDGEGYIEMNLGLGVLKERLPGDGTSSSDESESDDEAERPADEDGESETIRRATRPRDEDVLHHLMGRRKKKRKPGSKPVIEEMDV